MFRALCDLDCNNNYVSLVWLSPVQTLSSLHLMWAALTCRQTADGRN